MTISSPARIATSRVERSRLDWLERFDAVATTVYVALIAVVALSRTVVDGRHRVHERRRLPLLSNWTPSNPTLTIAALALRAVRPIQRAVTDYRPKQ
jgi:hypothetical protein